MKLPIKMNHQSPTLVNASKYNTLIFNVQQSASQREHEYFTMKSAFKSISKSHKNVKSSKV